VPLASEKISAWKERERIGAWAPGRCESHHNKSWWVSSEIVTNASRSLL